MSAPSSAATETQPSVIVRREGRAGRITLNEHIVKEAKLEHEVIFRGGFTTFQLSSPTPPKADRESESALTILRALRELGL